MPCYNPIDAWRAKSLNPSGKRGLVFNPHKGFIDMPVQVPCGQCIGCRLEKSRQWALRCVHEASLHDDNCFITLTYNDSHLPAGATLVKSDFQNFMKRFRFSIFPKKVRFYHCGEYGECDVSNPKHVDKYGLSDLGRPHYHALIFGHRFSGLEMVRHKDGIPLYTSSELADLWPVGFNTVGEVTFESAAYCARYITKKITGDRAEDHYKRVFVNTGEIVEVLPEYTTMSRRPGVGAGWFDQFEGDVYPKDFTTVRGKQIKPPKFYDRLLEERDYDLFEKVKSSRVKSAKKRKEDNTKDRLRSKEKVKQAQADMLKRSLND